MAMLANNHRNFASRLSEVQHEDNFEGFDGDPMEKDGAELELEKLVFGDEKGFHDDLKLHKKKSPTQYSSIVEEAREEGQEDAEDEGFEAVDDSAVRIVDLLLRDCHG